MNTQGLEIYFCRHAQSMNNLGHNSIDSPLSPEGRLQATKLQGYFDYIVCSPLRRAQETLHYSNITYGELIICPEFKERIFCESEAMLHDKRTSESDEEFFPRIEKFRQILTNLCNKVRPAEGQPVKKILLIGHGYYFNCWYRQACCAGPNNAEIMRITFPAGH